MIAMQVARIVADFSLFLDLTGEDQLDPDTAVEMTELLVARLENLDRDFLRDLVDAFPVIANEYTGDSEKIVRNIPRDFYLEETLAAGDPMRLAELEEKRDADD